jgi:serine protease SohB
MPNLVNVIVDALGPLVPARWRGGVPVVPVIRFSGVIGAAVPLRPGLSLASTAKLIERAFKTRNARAVALIVNSPGGSPSQSHLIFQRIRQLSAEKGIPVFAFIEDIGASGGYMLACSADEIVADVYSLVGSIGVVGGSFGFEKLIDKLGIERRLYTSGERKAMLDPFLPEKPEDVKRLKAIQKAIHERFIALVKERRGGRLKGTDKTLFSGEFWTAANALDLGLIDNIGDLRSFLRARFGDKVRTPLLSAEKGFIARRFGFGNAELPAGLVDEAISALEERAIWSRYGL